MGTLADKTIVEAKGDDLLDRQVHHVGDFKVADALAKQMADEETGADEVLPAEGTGEQIEDAEDKDPPGP